MAEIAADVPLSAEEITRVLRGVLDPDFDRSQALCRQVDPDLWFPPKGGSASEAKAICRRCEIRPACLRFALATNQPHGIWGGMTEEERNLLRRQILKRGKRNALARVS